MFQFRHQGFVHCIFTLREDSQNTTFKPNPLFVCWLKKKTMTLQTVCVFVFVVLVAVQCQVLDFTRQLTPDDFYCGRIQCVANSSQSIINMAIYDTTEKGNSVKLAFISVFAPIVSVDPSNVNVINVTGTISKYNGVLNVWFSRDFDCLYGAYQCELEFVNINGQPDAVRENLAPAAQINATLLYSLVKIDSQLTNTNTQLEGLKIDSEALKKDNEVLKQDNKGLKTVLDSVLVELSSIKGIMNSTLAVDHDKKNGSLCYRGMPHKSPREKFVLPGNIQALCDTESDGGGWIVLQRRVRGDVVFYRGWGDYKRGFGTPDTDFWIGNDLIHDLTSQGYNEFRVDFVHSNREYFAQYTNFTIGDELSGYLIRIGGYSGNVFDAMNYHNGYKFSTFDRDNDLSGSNCAVLFHGAWWYNACQYSNLNGAWAVANTTGISWRFSVNDSLMNLSFTEIKVRYNKR
ncbi:unnamed protein product [Candidula unifasciata]|uniref:Fibrinogen C-terminal domain-containing protein n=1 Tax=Candidula unifasciata TaxID=100452 RepID=A0A8S3ZIE5_9EUPU|nr:unnamed protein product [Candidula unifasciata]